MRIFGKNAAIAQTSEDIISKGGVLIDPTQARIHALVSDSANDTLSGTGARSIDVEGLTLNGFLESELVELNGITPVNTINKYHWLQLKVKTIGTGGKNAGLITATAETDNTVSCEIETGKNISEQAVVMVPRDVPSIIRFFSVKVYNSTEGAVTTIEIKVKTHGGVWVTEYSIDLSTYNPEIKINDSGILPKLKQLSMMKVSAVASAGSSSVNVIFDIRQQ